MDSRNNYVNKRTLNHKFLDNIWSQNGEDGIIGELLARIERDRLLAQYVVEFGAWDGRHLSNTFALVEKGYRAVYIEGDKEKYLELLKTCQSYINIHPINKFVSDDRESEESLDLILKETGCPFNYDVLSIDIDSADLDIWESHRLYKPKIVVIEIDSSFPPGIEKRHTSGMPGSSFTSTLKVASQKGYTLVAHTGNMILVGNEYVDSIGLEQRFIDDPTLLFNWFWYKLERESTLAKKYRMYKAFLIRKVNEVRVFLKQNARVVRNNSK